MKLACSNIITKAEGLFYNAMSSVMDNATILRLCWKHFNLRLSDEAQFQDMDVVVHNNQIAFEFDYTATAYFSILMDRTGTFLGMEKGGNQPKDLVGDDDTGNYLVDASFIRKKEIKLAGVIAKSIEKQALSRLIEVKSHVVVIGPLDFIGARFVVLKNQPVYNLIYQGNVTLSFLVDEKGRFLDFAKSKMNFPNTEIESKFFHAKDSTEMDNQIVADNNQEQIETSEINKDTEFYPLDDEEIQGIERLIIGERKDPEQNRALNE